MALRGDIVYFCVLRIDSYIYQLANMDNTVLGTNNEVCAAKPLTDKLEIHTLVFLNVLAVLSRIVAIL